MTRNILCYTNGKLQVTASDHYHLLFKVYTHIYSCKGYIYVSAVFCIVSAPISSNFPDTLFPNLSLEWCVTNLKRIVTQMNIRTTIKFVLWMLLLLLSTLACSAATRLIRPYTTS